MSGFSGRFEVGAEGVGGDGHAPFRIQVEVADALALVIEPELPGAEEQGGVVHAQAYPNCRGQGARSGRSLISAMRPEGSGVTTLSALLRPGAGRGRSATAMAMLSGVQRKLGARVVW